MEWALERPLSSSVRPPLNYEKKTPNIHVKLYGPCCANTGTSPAAANELNCRIMNPRLKMTVTEKIDKLKQTTIHVYKPCIASHIVALTGVLC
jgi:hypothetical protein